ncbi:uncharacterized protein G2W53_013726 [Senna tora]|uniref:Uncharacterized protein n=1 Tax=Senna tora TaxID=362788 RepID=A0A834WRD7_9FABA|nr:uncharacterized protein G2W53_013726 [Senna tora]
MDEKIKSEVMSSQGNQKAIRRFFKVVLPTSLQDGELVYVILFLLYFI